jgi:hypothetical protein
MELPCALADGGSPPSPRATVGSPALIGSGRGQLLDWIGEKGRLGGDEAHGREGAAEGVDGGGGDEAGAPAD